MPRKMRMSPRLGITELADAGSELCLSILHVAINERCEHEESEGINTSTRTAISSFLQNLFFFLSISKKQIHYKMSCVPRKRSSKRTMFFFLLSGSSGELSKSYVEMTHAAPQLCCGPQTWTSLFDFTWLTSLWKNIPVISGKNAVSSSFLYFIALPALSFDK